MTKVYKSGVLAWLLPKMEDQLPVIRVSDGSLLEDEAYNHPVIVLKCVYVGPTDFYTKYHVVLMTTYRTTQTEEYLRNRDARRDSRNSMPLQHPSSEQIWPELKIGGEPFPLISTTEESRMDRSKQSYVKLDCLIDTPYKQLRQFNTSATFDDQPELSEQSHKDLMDYFGMSDESQPNFQTSDSSDTARQNTESQSPKKSANTTEFIPDSGPSNQQSSPPPAGQVAVYHTRAATTSAPPTLPRRNLPVPSICAVSNADVRLLQCRNVFGANAADPRDLFAWTCIETNALPATALAVIDRIIRKLEITMWGKYIRTHDPGAMMFFPPDGIAYPPPADVQQSNQQKLAGSRQLKPLILQLGYSPSAIAIEPTYVYGQVGWYVREDVRATRIREVVRQQVLGQRGVMEPGKVLSIVMIMIAGQVSFVLVLEY